MLAALAEPKQIGFEVITLAASIGISVYPQNGEDLGTLVDRADAAMYRAKRQGRGGFLFHGDAECDAGEANASQTWVDRRATHTDERFEAQASRQQSLQEANEHLVLAALNAQQLQAVAERSQRRQVDFLAILAHELRNPLTPIRTAAALLDQVPPQELPRVRAVIERQVLNMSRLISDLLDMSRINTGKLRLARQPVELGAVLDNAVEACGPALMGRQQKIHQPHSAGAGFWVNGDALRLTQVLSNLIDNASKFTPPLGVIELSMGSTDGGQTVVTTVADSGIGISFESLESVFDPFEQTDSGVSFEGGGLGIGLALVRELVVAHGGQVTAHSKGSNCGSQFSVSLPLILKPDEALA